MELMQEVKGYSDSREEEEEEEEAAEEIITREDSSSKHHYPFSSTSLSLSSAPSISNYTSTTAAARPHHHHHHHVINIPHQQNPWLGMNIHDHDHHLQSPETTESHNSSSGLGLLHQHQDAAGSNFIISNHHHHHHHTTKQLDFMDLTLGSSKDEGNLQGSGGGASSVFPHHASGSSSADGNVNNLQQPSEKEHMFDKVVTPSDVGKLNRLVIPKQHAEKYFPLDSSANEKGLLLNFEDRNGKLWRFRYSYWNSSQSYVMTKGWSRFVKEKKLDAGDIVSFQRGVGELYRHRLYIDWRRRPDHHHHQGPDPSGALFTPFFLPNQPHFIRWGATGRLYTLPSQNPPRHHDHLQQHLNYNTMYHQHHHPFHHQLQGGGGGGGNGTHHYNYHDMSTSGSGSVYYLRSTPQPMPLTDHQILNTRQQQEGGNVSHPPIIIDSVPVAHHHHHHHHHGGKSGSSTSTSPSTAGKILRLFGVNMECASSTSEDPNCFSLLSSSSMAHVTMANSNSPPSSSQPPLQLLREDLLSSPSSARFGDQRGEPSMLFDLDPSLQYRQ